MSRKSPASRSKKPPPAPPETAASAIDFSALPFFNHPSFQAIYAEWQARGCVLQEFISTFAAGRYAIKDNDAFKEALEDVFDLYDVAAGRKPASELLRAVEKNAPDVFYCIVVDLAQYLAPHLEKFIREMSDAGPYDPAKLAAIELLAAAKDWERKGPTFQHRMEVSRAFGMRVDELSRQAGLTDADEMRNIRDQLAKKVGADPELIVRVDAWDLSEIPQLFSEHRKEVRSIN